jgi:phage terminase large subunit-like protein
MKRWLLGVVLAFLIASMGMAAMFDETRAQRAVAFFENLKHTKGKFAGKPFVLLPWEKEIIRTVYGTVDEQGRRTIKFVYVEIPKKNGKSELAAGAALYHTFADGEIAGEVYGCAADRKQASIVYKVARDMIDQVPALKKRAKVTDSQKVITDTKTGTTYEVLSAEAFTKHGLNLSACVFDELHAQPSRDLWDVMTFGAGDAREQPIWWIITTAGDDPDRVSIGWEEHDYAMKILAGEIVDPTWYVVIYNYDGDDIYNEDNWAKANPSLGHTIKIESVREAAAKAKEKPADERLFRWLRLNQWITSKLTTWLPLSLYEQSVGEWNRTDLVGLDCYMGLDLSSTTDLSSLALIFPPQGAVSDWRVIWENWIPEEGMRERISRDKVKYDEWAAGGWVIPTPGVAVDYTLIKDRILELSKIYKVQELCADRTFAAMLLQELEKEGFTCVDIRQTYQQLTDPLNQTEVLLKTKQLTHEANPVAGWAFGNASIAKNGNGQIKLVKEHRGKSVVRTKRIDPIAAWMDGMARARFYESGPKRSIYENRGLREL